MHDVDDLFSGAGGWAEGAQMLGLTTRGYECWAPAAATYRAAGHDVVEGDVRAADPLVSNAPGLVGGPPCQAFSVIGTGVGRAAMDRLAAALRSAWWFPEPGDDERATLILEPYRWIAQRLAVGRPYQWIAMEQVPPALPLWDVYAEWLRSQGYGTWTGILAADRYGVGQSRRRAVALAIRGGAATDA